MDGSECSERMNSAKKQSSADAASESRNADMKMQVGEIEIAKDVSSENLSKEAEANENLRGGTNAVSGSNSSDQQSGNDPLEVSAMLDMAVSTAPKWQFGQSGDDDEEREEGSAEIVQRIQAEEREQEQALDAEKVTGIAFNFTRLEVAMKNRKSLFESNNYMAFLAG